MLLYVLEAARAVEPERIVVVLGYGHEQVEPHLPGDCVMALQDRQLGTGHAVLAAAGQIVPGPLLVLPGDTPLLTGDALRALVRDHVGSGATATVLTMELEDPTGYGRIVRAADGSVLRIVEQRDATPEELAIREVNSSMYVLPSAPALEILGQVGYDNDQREIYLTDVIAGLCARGERVAAAKVDDPSLVLGVNSQDELAQAEALMARRLAGQKQARGRQQ
jgi:bifunctional UDP-N-acetylglucosamine pyrophosphorylase/glucosamine-1-phosphate N-acetyltransferase